VAWRPGRAGVAPEPAALRLACQDIASSTVPLKSADPSGEAFGHSGVSVRVWYPLARGRLGSARVAREGGAAL